LACGTRPRHALGLGPDTTRLHAPVQATKAALRAVADRIVTLTEEITRTGTQLRVLVAQAAPRTMGLLGVSVEHAGQLMVTAGQNPERLRSESAFAALCVASPIPASSGKPTGIDSTRQATEPPIEPCT
jgi:hypothetical protein